MTLSFAHTGQFLIKNVVPQESGESAKVKVKVRVNVHGVFSVSSASLIEVVKTAEGEEPMETDQTVKEEEVCVCARRYQRIALHRLTLGFMHLLSFVCNLRERVSTELSVWSRLGFNSLCNHSGI